MVEPNPIDFDKVFAGFKNIGENLSVMVAIISVFLSYVLFVIWGRKADRRDASTVGLTDKTLRSENVMGRIM
mgnify:CR=1 FL=1